MDLADQAAAGGDHPFGALLVRDGQIILEARNTVNTERDITGHAELNLVREAFHTLPPEVVQACTLYTSTEPCPMCAGAIYWAGIPRVVYACSAERLGEIAGSSFVIPCREVLERGLRQVHVEGSLLEEDAAVAHLHFW